LGNTSGWSSTAQPQHDLTLKRHARLVMLHHKMVLKQHLLTVIAASNAGNCAAS